MRYPILLIILLLSTGGCYLSEELPPDQEVWGYEQPGNLGLNENFLLTVNDQIRRGDYENVEGLLVVKDGNIVFENYWQEGSRIKLEGQRRNTSLFATIGIGILIKEKLLDSLSTPIHLLLPNYQSYFDSEPAKKQITVSHLLSHRSGLIWDEINVVYDSELNDLSQMKRSQNWVEYVLEKPLEAPPGLRLTYNTGTSIVLARIIENLSGKPVEEFIAEKVFKPLKIKEWYWESGQGVATNLADGLHLSLLDLTKIGYLYINGGFWNGREIVPNNYIRNTTRGEVDIRKNINYASNWWYFSDEYFFVQSLRENDLFYFSNDIGTGLYVVPHLNMVVTIGASNYFYGNFNPSLNLFFNILNSREITLE